MHANNEPTMKLWDIVWQPALANHIVLALMWIHGRLSTAGPPQMTKGPGQNCPDATSGQTIDL